MDYALTVVISSAVRSNEDCPVGFFWAGMDRPLLLAFFVLGGVWVVGKGRPLLYGGLISWARA